MKYSQVLVFLLLLLADLIAMLSHNRTLEFIFKPLLCAWLLLCFLYRTKAISTRVKKFVTAALVLAWLGDIMLLFQSVHPAFFIAGLTAFLFAHVAYILFFKRMVTKSNRGIRWFYVLPVTVYYFLLMWLLTPFLGGMQWPVWIYGLVISVMLVFALHLYHMKNEKAGLLIMTGAIFFVISDTLLAFNKFYHSFEYAGFWVMITYGMAQLFIISGACNYLISGHNE